MSKAHPRPNDHRSNSKNPNNPDSGASRDNRANQLNPKHPAYQSSRKSEPPVYVGGGALAGEASSAIIDFGAMVDISWGCEGCVARLTAQHTTSADANIEFEHTCPTCGSSYSVELAPGPRGPVWRVFPKNVTSKEPVPLVIYPEVDSPSFDEEV